MISFVSLFSSSGDETNVFVDAGSQLVTLNNVEFSIRDLNNRVYDSMGMKVNVATPKAHEDRGRVEAKVKVLRSMLNKLSIKSSRAMPTLSWETVFAKVANSIDSVPLCKGNSSNVRDWGFEIITSNRLKLGRNNQRSLEDSLFLTGNTYTDVLEAVRKCQRAWYQVMLDHLHHFMPKPRKWVKTDPVSINDVVIFIHNDSGSGKMMTWILGKVVKIIKNTLHIEYYAPNTSRLLTIERKPRQVSKIYAADEIPINSLEYYTRHIEKLDKSGSG